MSRHDQGSQLQRFPPLESELPATLSEHQETTLPGQNDGLSLPPIYTSPSIITVQPRNLNENRQNRTSTDSASNIDWVSAPRAHLNVFSGTYFLSSVEQLEIQQVVDLNSLLGKSRNGAQYRVRVPREETVFLAIEDSTEYQRTFLRSSRPLTLNIMDPSGETAYIIRKSLSWGCLPGYLHKVTVESTDYVGSIEQNLTVIGVSFTVYDDARRPLCYIEGPNVYSCCMSSETQFQIVSMDKTRQVASVIRHWDHFLLDNTILLTFPANTNIKLKGLLLGAAFLLEFLFFERNRT